MRDQRDRGVIADKQTSLSVTMRRVARWLELRSFGLTPEHFSMAEAKRAAVAVAIPLVLAIATGQHYMGWAIFAAFWTCLCDSPGPDRHRRFLLLLFVLFGTVITFLGGWAASFGHVAAIIAGPSLVLLCVLMPWRLAHSSMLATLLAVVGVVAVGFPKPAEPAALQAAAFLGGSLWAYALINGLMHVDDWLPIRQATNAVLMRLTDMTSDLVITSDRPHRDNVWHREHAAHRRSVRIAIERLRNLLVRYQSEPQDRLRPFLTLRDTSETIFSALIALDHTFILRKGRAADRLDAAIAILDTLIACRGALSKGAPNDPGLARVLEPLHQSCKTMEDETLKGCLIAVEQAVRHNMLPLAEQSHLAPVVDHEVPPQKPSLKTALRHALRQSAGVLAVYYVAMLFNFGYPYWATMAVVVVLQGAARLTWTRSLERIFGSLLGGLITVGFLHLVHEPLVLCLLVVPLAGLTIALRSVNYTVFVVILTMLFIIVTELLQPGAGVASARILDNAIGSLTALAAVLVLWPDLGAPLSKLAEEGLRANRAYLDAVEKGADVQDIIKARRAAGLASINAEIAIHDLGGILRRFHGVSDRDGAALLELRLLAGEAAGAWHRHLAQPSTTVNDDG
ncbi:FUSC family protein [Rhizobium sp.]|jgi:hypothetical protein|uniref:FUSC family protein n=1 Tax=Rhizobium sp. TaxID=391 RepID=UPI000E8C6029|nr:FUSC family protein [Rhizobium sp.]